MELYYKNPAKCWLEGFALGMAERENVWGKEKTEDMAGGWQC